MSHQKRSASFASADTTQIMVVCVRTYVHRMNEELHLRLQTMRNREIDTRTFCKHFVLNSQRFRCDRITWTLCAHFAGEYTRNFSSMSAINRRMKHKSRRTSAARTSTAPAPGVKGPCLPFVSLLTISPKRASISMFPGFTLCCNITTQTDHFKEKSHWTKIRVSHYEHELIEMLHQIVLD